MLPGCVAVWLTTDPGGNEITERHLAFGARMDGPT
jgi:hypothetical protein